MELDDAVLRFDQDYSAIGPYAARQYNTRNDGLLFGLQNKDSAEPKNLDTVNDISLMPIKQDDEASPVVQKRGDRYSNF